MLGKGVPAEAAISSLPSPHPGLPQLPPRIKDEKPDFSRLTSARAPKHVSPVQAVYSQGAAASPALTHCPHRYCQTLGTQSQLQ